MKRTLPRLAAADARPKAAPVRGAVVPSSFGMRAPHLATATREGTASPRGWDAMGGRADRSSRLVGVTCIRD